MNTKAGRKILAATVCAVATTLAVAASVNAGDVVINEFWVQDGWSPSAQYVELYNKGASSVSLSGYSLITVDGDTYGYAGSYNYRWVTFRLDLSGTIAAGSRFLIGSGLTPNPDLSFRLGDLSSTGTQTFALVRTSNIAYTTDGVHLTQASVDAITGNTLTDAVTNWDGDVGDDGYFNAPVITEYPAYYSAWSTASRMPDGGDWSNTYGQYNQTTPTPVELGDATYDFLSTPGKANGKTGTAYPRQLWGACCTGTGGTTCSYVQSGTCSGTYKGNWRDCSHPRNPCDPNSWVSNNIQYAKTQGSGWGGRIGPVTVTCILDLAASSNSQTIVVQDTSGTGGAARGITIFGINATIASMLTGVSKGSVITVEGTTTDEPYGTFELLDNAYMPLARVGTITAGTMPAPVTGRTCADLRTPAISEPLESVRVKISCVSFISTGTFSVGASGSSFTITDGTAFFEVFVPTTTVPLANQTIPTTPVDITGILGQHDITKPYDTAYQLIMYDPADIVAATGCTTGRCCQPSGTCIVSSAAVCSQLCGVWTSGGNCGSACTPITTGACKMPGTGPCYDGYTLTQCNTAGGSYWGDGSTCAHGQCYAPMTLDQVRALEGASGLVKLTDVVVSSTTDLVNSTNSRNMMVQDSSGTAGAARGITIWGANADVFKILNGPDGIQGTSDDVVPGDHITISGLVNDFQGLLEFVIPMSLVSKGAHGAIPTPTKVTASDFQDPLTAEPFESVLVQVDCLTFTTTGNFIYGNHYARHGGNPPDVNIRVSTSALDLVGQPIPTKPVNLTGILSQNGNIYQLLLRSLADIHYECPETCYGMLGDFNNNNDVDLGDVPAFVNALLGLVPNGCGDMNSDGVVNGLDVQVFISKLMHEPPAGTIAVTRCDSPTNTCPTQDQSGFNEFCRYIVVDDAYTQAMLVGLPSCVGNGLIADTDSLCVLCSVAGAVCPANNGVDPNYPDTTMQVFRWKDALGAGLDCYFAGYKVTSDTCYSCLSGDAAFRFRVSP